MATSVRTRLALAISVAAVAALLSPVAAGAVGPVPHFEKCSPGCDIVVNSQKDQPDAHPGDGRCRTAAGKCTLRAAVEEANARSRSRIWRVLVPGGHYTLTRHGLDDTADRGDLDLLFRGEVVGAGQSHTIVDGDGADRIFELVGDDERVAHLTVTNGYATDGPGGGILLDGETGVAHHWVQYVGINDSEAAAADAFDSGQGGALGVYGHAIVSDSTFAYNTAVRGGAVLWSTLDNAALEYDALIQNHASEDGGGVYLSLDQGSQLLDDTISGNTASQHGGGVFLDADTHGTFLRFQTIASNTSATGLGGGIWRDGESPSDNPNHIGGSIVAKNGVGNDCAGPGEADSFGGNTDSDNTCVFNGEPDNPGRDPQLGPVAYNGGPTPTRALKPGSIAIDHALICTAFDQRGAPRPYGSACDEGAYEVGVCCAKQEKPFIHHHLPPPPKSYCGVIVRGTNGPDTLRGNRRRNEIHGRGGNDRIFGGFQADCLHGGRGNDYVRGGEGTDSIIGDSGDDKLSGGDQEDTILGEAGRDRILGGADDDKLYGGPGADYIKGGGGFDRISGGPGNDRIDATGGGLDEVDCGSGDDHVRAKRLEHLYNCEHVHYVG